MARAFIASVPLAVVLVAALVVPLEVIPGTFGFESWPTAPGAKVIDHQVTLAAPRPAPQVVRVRTARPHAPAAPRPLTVASLPANAAPARTQVSAPAPTRGGRRAPAVVRTPPAHTPSHPHSSPSAGTPATPSAPPDQQPQPSPQPPPTGVATNDPPIAREDPAAHPAPTPPPSPVQQVVPQRPPVRPADLPPVGRGDAHCDGEGHAEGHGRSGDGLGLGRGHGHDHGGD